MKTSDSSKIKKAIEEALIEDSPDVRYYPPTSDGQCGYFNVTTNGNLSLAEINNCLRNVVEEYNLGRDPHFNGTFDLNAYWDKKSTLLA